jgi:hypothetical protein
MPPAIDGSNTSTTVRSTLVIRNSRSLADELDPPPAAGCFSRGVEAELARTGDP